MDILRVSSKGQIVIPEEVRKRTGIRKGDKLILQEEENTIVLKKENLVEQQLRAHRKQEAFAGLLLAEKMLAKDWLAPEEEEAWKNL